MPIVKINICDMDTTACYSTFEQLSKETGISHESVRNFFRDSDGVALQCIRVQGKKRGYIYISLEEAERFKALVKSGLIRSR